MSENVSLAEIDDIMVVRQLPVIEEQLQNIKTGIEEKVAGILALECTEDTVRAIKVFRSSLSKDFQALEERRKMVKSKVLEPYEAFEKIYKDCVTNIYKSADDELKRRVTEVEDALKAEKQKEIVDYFNEYRDSKHIDFVEFPDAGISVGLSASKKSLKEAAKKFIDRIVDDLTLIDTQEHKEEILFEYKQSLNASAAITSVLERHRAIEAELERQKVVQAAKEAEQEAVQKVNEVKVAAPLSAPKTISKDDEVIIMALPGGTKVQGKRSDCRMLKELLQSKFQFVK